jgi:hypothetical protein
MNNFPTRRRWAEALGYYYEGHLRGLGKVFSYVPLVSWTGRPVVGDTVLRALVGGQVAPQQ